MEGFSLYFWSIFIVSICNVWLLFAFIFKISRLRIRRVVLFLLSLILVVLKDFFLTVELIPFSTLKNALITLAILIGLHAVVSIFNRNFKKNKAI